MPELPAAPMPVEEVVDIMSTDLATLSESKPDFWAIMFAALDRAIEAHKP